MKLALSLALAVGLSVLGSYAFPHFSPLAIIDSAFAPASLSKPVPIAASTAVASAPTDLFFSEYVEGAFSNKAIEIYNGTAAAISMDTGGYVLQLYTNGSSTPVQQAISFGVSIQPGEAAVFAHPNSDPSIIAMADYTNSAVLNFTGDDTIVLRKGGASGPIVDVIGQIGFDPGLEWGTGVTSTADNTLVRKSTVCAGDTVGSDAFNPANEWNGFAADTLSNLGTHTANCVALADFTNLQYPPTITVDSGQVTGQIYGRIYEAGVTETAGGSGTVTAQLGYGPLGSDPRTSPSWTFSAAAFNAQVGNDDEYAATITAPSPPSTTQYSYTYRFSLDGGSNWTYADLNGNGTNSGLTFDPAQLGTMTVNFIPTVPEINVTPTSMSFGNQAIGTTSGTRSVTISNTGTGSLNIGQLVKSGASASEFTITADPSDTVVAPGATAKVRATFTPAGDPGSRTATITIPSNDSDEPNTVVTLSATAIAAAAPSPVKSMWVWIGDPVTNLGERNRMVARAVAEGITDIYVSVYQSTPNLNGRLMYASSEIAALASRAHADGIRVWAAYGDPAWQDQPCSNGQSAYERMEEVVAFNAERPADQGFDGVMLDVEPGAAFNLTNYANMHNCFRGILPSNIRLGTAINAFWHAPSQAAVEYPAGGELKAPAEHIIDLPLDQVVVMGYRDNAGSTGGNGIIGLDENEIAYATSVGKAGLVLAGLETKDLGDPPNEHVTFFEEGQAALDSESALVASHFAASSGFGGFSIHAYFDEYQSGAPNWPDSIAAPNVATDSATDVAGTSATLNGLVTPNGLATIGYFYYGTDNSGGCLALGSRMPASGGTDLGSGTSELPFSQAISGLTPSMTYYFCAVAESTAGTRNGSVFQFTTSSPPSQVATADATNVTAVTVTLNGLANPNGDEAIGYFRYSSTDPGACTDSFGTRTPASGGSDLGSGTTQLPFSQAVSGLTPSTTYYFCAFAQNSAGVSSGAKFSFTTAGVPDAVSAPATSIHSTSATLNGFGTPNGAPAIGYFRYGTTDPTTCDNTFGTRAPVSSGVDLGSGNTQIPFSQEITGLSPNTTYYVCVAVENDGGTDFGPKVSFSTGGRTLVVDRLVDDPSINACTGAANDCGIRGALAVANGGDTVTFDPSLFASGSRQYLVEYSAPLLIEDNVSIIGPGADLLMLRGGSFSYPIFEIASGLDAVSISGMQLFQGYGGAQAGGLHIGASTVTLDRMWISDNQKGIYSEGTVTIANSAISGNYAGEGAGIHNVGGTLSISNSTISGNQSYGTGSKGGAIYSDGGTVNLSSVTITGNSAEIGSGVAIESGSANIRNTVIAANTNNAAIPDVSGTFTSSGFNIIGNGTGASGLVHGVNGDQVGPIEDGSAEASPSALVPIDPKLGPLANNGGSTPTHAPLAGSPVIDKGFSFGSTTDQRAMPKPQDLGSVPNVVGGDGSDIGAYEMLAPTAATVSITGRVTNASGIAIRDARITVQGIDGSVRAASTNSFGYYRVTGLAAGGSYVLSVSARRYAFSPASVVVNLSDNIDGLNFRASP